MSQSKEYDAAMVVPESITVITPEGNLHLMTELVLQIKEFTRKIETETEQIQIWKKRLELSRSQGDPSLTEDIENRIRQHERARLDAQMELSTLEDKRAELRFQSKGPTAEQKFRTAQAQHLVNQFAEMGISAADEQLKKQFVRAEAGSALDSLKERMNVGSSIAALQPTPQTNQPSTSLTPGDLRRGAPLSPRLTIKDSTFQRVDAINFGKDAPAEKHQFSITSTYEVKHLESSFPNGRKLADDGLCTNGEISFELGQFALQQSVLLLFRVDAAEAQHIETSINGNIYEGTPIERDTTTRWRHQTLLVPAAQMTTPMLRIVRKSKNGSHVSLYAVWAYQDTKTPDSSETSTINHEEIHATTEQTTTSSEEVTPVSTEVEDIEETLRKATETSSQEGASENR